MRKSKLEAAQTREAIVAAAADLIRRTGIVEASLADMMAAAGLTHGGFYRHFRNKEHLVSEALSAAGDKTIATIGRHIAKGGLNAARRRLPIQIPPRLPDAHLPLRRAGERDRPFREADKGRGDGAPRESSLSRSPETRPTESKRAAPPSSSSPR